MLTDQAEFTFDKLTHTYRYNGHVIPSCTQILKHFGLIDETKYTARGRMIGEAVHLATHYIDKGTLRWESVRQDEIAGRLRAYLRFKADTGFAPEWREKPSYYPGGLYAATPDAGGRLPGVTEHALIEIKCGQKEAWHGMQLAMQARTLPDRPWQRYVLYLHADGTYTLDPKTDQSDFCAVGLASVWWWKVNNGYMEAKNGHP